MRGLLALALICGCGPKVPAQPPSDHPTTGEEGGSDASSVGVIAGVDALSPSLRFAPPQVETEPPTEAAAWLRAVAAGEERPRIDSEFNAKLYRASERVEPGTPLMAEPAWGDLDALLSSIPDGCVPIWTSGGGYEAVAIPPAMVEDSGPLATLVDQVIDGLLAGEEVLAHCLVDGCDDLAEEDCPDEIREYYLFAVNIIRDAEGNWTARGWTDLRYRGW